MYLLTQTKTGIAAGMPALSGQAIITRLDVLPDWKTPGSCTLGRQSTGAQHLRGQRWPSFVGVKSANYNHEAIIHNTGLSKPIDDDLDMLKLAADPYHPIRV